MACCSAHHDGVGEAAQQHDDAEDHVHDADALVVDAGEPLAPEIAPQPEVGDGAEHDGATERNTGKGRNQDGFVQRQRVRASAARKSLSRGRDYQTSLKFVPVRSWTVAARRIGRRGAGRGRPAPTEGCRVDGRRLVRNSLPSPSGRISCRRWRRRSSGRNNAAAPIVLIVCERLDIIDASEAETALGIDGRHLVHAHFARLDAHVEDQMEKLRIDACETADGNRFARLLEVEIFRCDRACRQRKL